MKRNNRRNGHTPMTPVKRQGLVRKLVTFESEADIEAVALAQLGLTNKVIEEATGLSNHQINYRLFKAKSAEGYDIGHTYRSEWRNGTGEAVRSVMSSLVPVLKKDVKATLPKLFKHPTPETVNLEL